MLAILGILKAGGAYVPIDPDYRRIGSAYGEDTGAGIVVSGGSYAELLKIEVKRIIDIEKSGHKDREVARVCPSIRCIHHVCQG